MIWSTGGWMGLFIAITHKNYFSNFTTCNEGKVELAWRRIELIEIFGCGTICENNFVHVILVAFLLVGYLTIFSL